MLKCANGVKEAPEGPLFSSLAPSVIGNSFYAKSTIGAPRQPSQTSTK
jgi:hypothetical protein